jgi:HAD superfamily hydrolase (TIGR01509 family)
MTIKGLIFDFDGLILDTETPEYLVLQDIFKTYGTMLPVSEWGAALGASLEAFDPMVYLERKVNYPLDRLALRKLWRLRSNVLIEQQQPLPGVLQTIQRAQDLGLKLAVASSSPRNWVINHLSRLKLLEPFEKIMTAEDVLHVKPEPDLYLECLRALGLKSTEALAFEDSPNGIKAARAAGLFCIAVPNPVTRQLEVDHADLVIDSLVAVTLDELIEKANHRS